MKTSLLDRALRFLGRSQFFTYSALLHILLIAALGTQVYMTAHKPEAGMVAIIPEPPDKDRGDRNASNEPPSEAQPVGPISDPIPGPADPKNFKGGVVSIPLGLFNPGLPHFTDGTRPPSPSPGPAGPSERPIPKSPFDKNARPTAKQLKELRQATDHQVSGPHGSLNGKYAFTLYVAKYEGGDWSSTHQVQAGVITGGALPNLAYVIRTWTKEKVDAQVDTHPLDLASQEIFTVRPPFIYFTGTRDFTLTTAEVENLRKYILVGGAIWGDSSLPGRNSRFDIAFRREMARVVGDKSMSFEALPLDHPIFNGMKYNLAEVPAGLNFYAEPVYAIRMYGELSIIYTPNDYGDMMTVGLNADAKVDTRRDANNRFVAIDSNLWENQSTYFRNVNEASLEKTYQFSTNLVYYLLTRWQVRQEF